MSSGSTSNRITPTAEASRATSRTIWGTHPNLMTAVVTLARHEPSKEEGSCAACGGGGGGGGRAGGDGHMWGAGSTKHKARGDGERCEAGGEAQGVGCSAACAGRKGQQTNL